MLAPLNYGNVVSGSVAHPSTVNGTYFYARVCGFIAPTVSGVYTLGVNCQDGCNLFIGDRALVSALDQTDTASSSLAYTRSATLDMTAGVYYPVVVEWQHGTGISYEMQLIWTPPGGSIALIPAANLTTDEQSITGTLDAVWWNGTSGLWYPTGNGMIDFSNPAHANKTLDHIDDGTSYSRVPAATVADGIITTTSLGSGLSGYVSKSGSDMTGPLGLPQYAYASLPAGATGRLAFCTNGLKVGETTGSGTGVPVYYSAGSWRVFATDSPVAI